MNYYLDAFRNYKDFEGRATRKQFWMFMLIHFIICACIGIVSDVSHVLGNILFAVYLLIVVIPAAALSFRRLHDINRSAWWILIGFIPVVGAIVLLIFYVQKGTEGPNRFGAGSGTSSAMPPMPPAPPAAPSAPTAL